MSRISIFAVTRSTTWQIQLHVLGNWRTREKNADKKRCTIYLAQLLISFIMLITFVINLENCLSFLEKSTLKRKYENIWNKKTSYVCVCIYEYQIMKREMGVAMI